MGRTCYCCDKKETQECTICYQRDYPDIPENFSKTKFIISGFEDYNIDSTYSGPFYSSAKTRLEIDPRDLYGRKQYAFFGNASFRYYVSVSGLNQLNTTVEFERSGNKFVPKEKTKLLGEIIVTTFVETSISGDGYALFDDFPCDVGCGNFYCDCSLVNTFGCSKNCDPTEECEPISSGPFLSINSAYQCLSRASIPSEWGGKIGAIARYDIYLIINEYSCDTGKDSSMFPYGDLCYNRNNNLIQGHMPMINTLQGFGGYGFSQFPQIGFNLILKETEVIEEGIYKNVGFLNEVEQFSQCYPQSGPARVCPDQNQQPCETIVVKAKKRCRSPIYNGSYPTQYFGSQFGLHHDISEKLFFPYKCQGGRCAPPPNGGGVATRKWGRCRQFINHYNFDPFPAWAYMSLIDSNATGNRVNSDELMSFRESCDISVFSDISRYFPFVFNFGYQNDCYSNFISDDPCNFCASYDDATKQIIQKYKVINTESGRFFPPEEVINKTNYKKVFSPCDFTHYLLDGYSCDLSDTSGIGIRSRKYTVFSSIPSTNGLDWLTYIFGKQLGIPVTGLGLGTIRGTVVNGCPSYAIYPPSPFYNLISGGWGNANLNFIKFQDRPPPWPTVSCQNENTICTKTFAEFPNLDWQPIEKSNGAITTGLTWTITPVQINPIEIPIPPPTFIEVIYEK
jgi:hypothetical protein